MADEAITLGLADGVVSSFYREDFRKKRNSNIFDTREAEIEDIAKRIYLKIEEKEPKIKSILNLDIKKQIEEMKFQKNKTKN